MFEEEPAGKAKLDLERLSVDELKMRIETLKADIAACEAEIEKKQAHKSAADDIFKT